MLDNLGFTVLYEQNGCLVVNKPPGVLTQAVPGVDSLEVRVKKYLAGDRGGGKVYLNVIHRLDRPASGAIIFGKDLRTTRKLGQQFEHRRVQKVYWACVAGRSARKAASGRILSTKLTAKPVPKSLRLTTPRAAVPH